MRNSSEFSMNGSYRCQQTKLKQSFSATRLFRFDSIFRVERGLIFPSGRSSDPEVRSARVHRMKEGTRQAKGYDRFSFDQFLRSKSDRGEGWATSGKGVVASR